VARSRLLLAVRQVGAVGVAGVVVVPHVDPLAMVHAPGGDEALHHDAEDDGDGPGGDQEAPVAGWRQGMRSHADYLWRELRLLKRTNNKYTYDSTKERSLAKDHLKGKLYFTGVKNLIVLDY